MNAYIDKHVAIHRPAGQLAFFDEETNRYKHELDQAEGQLKRFSQEQGGVAPQVSRDITLQKLNEFAASLETTRAEMAGTEQKIANLEKQAGTTPDRLTTAVREADDGAVQQQLKSTLLALELKRTELLTKYQPGYRLVQEVDKQIADTRAAIVAEGSKPLHDKTTDRNPTYSWINAELAKARAEYSSLQARAVATQAIVGVYQGKAQKLEESGLGNRICYAKPRPTRTTTSCIYTSAKKHVLRKRLTAPGFSTLAWWNSPPLLSLQRARP